tara:strand:+ start:197 stop:2155 length:1959 start_codon:yes stop_codon:yes gene_type:complete
MNTSFRLDIQGLRAIAVILVILFHTKLNFFNAGYIGVDIFFVISGYLITQIIYKDITKNKFSLFEFYNRRARRILPALFITILIVILFSFFFTLDSGFKFIGKSIFSTLFFYSNFFFWNQNLDYYGLDGEFNPLVHTWSLSFEEQFYLVFPIFLIFFFRNHLIKIIIFLITLSILFAQLGGNLKFEYPFFEENLYFWNPSFYGTFFSPIGRVWELLFGSLICIIQNRFVIKKNNKLSLISFLILFLSLYFIDNNSQIPSLLLLPVIVSTGLIILFNDEKKNKYLQNIVLNSKLSQFIGNISYSLYLVHLPVFVFCRYISFGELNLFKILICISISILISYVIWKLIEQPFRNKKKINTKFFIVLSLTAIFIFTSIGLLIQKNFINSYRFNEMKKSYPKIYGDTEEMYLSKIRIFRDEVMIPKNFSKNLITKKVLIIGDSHSENLFRALELNKEKFPSLEFANYKLKLHKLNEYYNNDKEYKKFFNSSKYKKSDIIIVSNLYSYIHPTRTYRDDLSAVENLAKKIKFDKKRFILTGNGAVFFGAGDNALKFILNKNKNKFLTDNKAIFSEDTKRNKFRLLNIDIKKQKKIKELAIKLNIKYLNRLDYACNTNEQVCDAVTPEGDIIFFDYSHTTMKGAKYFGSKIASDNWLEF